MKQHRGHFPQQKFECNSKSSPNKLNDNKLEQGTTKLTPPRISRTVIGSNISIGSSFEALRGAA